MSKWLAVTTGAVVIGVMMLAAITGAVAGSQPSDFSGSCGLVKPTGKYTAADITALWIAHHGSTASTSISGIGDVPNPLIAGAVGMAESAGDPNVVNSIGAGGLMQINPPEPNYLDPDENMKIAVRKFNAAHGWSPWEAFTGHDGVGDDGPWRTYLTVTANPIAATCSTEGNGGGAQTLEPGAQWLMPVPGTGAQCDRRIVPDLVWILATYHAAVGDCYAPTGHEALGEHPLGLGADIYPARDGSWDLIDKLAADLGWRASCGATGCAEQSFIKPFRFIGYDGYPGHGRGNHIHLSWGHSPGPPPVQTVYTLR